MATIYSEFLLQKFVKEFQETEKVCPDLSLLTNFKEICNILQNKKFTRQHLIDMKDDLYEINDALVERIGLAEDRRGKGKALSIRSGKELWRFYKTRHRLCAIRDKLQKMEAVEEEVITSQVLVIKKEHLIRIDLLSEYHGLDDQMVKIENLLCQNGGNKAIGIVGMCGSGKSALARKVIFSPIVKQLFELILWIDLSKAMKSEQKYECISVKGKDDFEKISLNPCSGLELCKLLASAFLNPPSKCLVVLDGVWHVIDGLNTLIQDIVDSPINGSIIITCRRPQVVKKLLPNEKSYLHRIQPISKDECWSVFWDSIQRKTFIDSHSREKILEMKDEILDRCDGLPLAAKTLAEIIAIQIRKNDFWTDERVLKDITFRVDVHDYFTLKKINDLVGGRIIDDRIFGIKRYFVEATNPIALLKKVEHICFTELLEVMYSGV